MQIIGHRGACGYAPENTLASFKKALELGVDGIELDVHLLASGELVAMHDNRVDRTTNGNGYVADYDFVTLRALDAGNGEKIPTLNEVLDLVDKRVTVNIELKGLGTAMAVAELIDSYTAKGWSDDHFIISSFNHVELAIFRKRMPLIRTGALMSGIPVDYAAFASNLNTYSVNPDSEYITLAFVDDAKAKGLKVFVFGVDAQSEVERMQSMGVDGIFSDYPDRARSYDVVHV